MNAASINVSLRDAVFLDRDGVINRKLPENCYVSKPSEFEILPGVAEALSILNKLGYLLVMITNQRGIARGFMTTDDLQNVHQYMFDELKKSGLFLDALYFCPHEENEKCSCRKPEPGMLLAASKDLEIALGNSFTVGDSPSDVDAGQRAGTRTVRIAAQKDENADLTFSSLLDFALFLERQVLKDSNSVPNTDDEERD